MDAKHLRHSMATRLNPVLGQAMVVMPILAVCLVVGGAWEFTRHTLDLSRSTEDVEFVSRQAGVQLRHLDHVLDQTANGLAELTSVEWKARTLTGLGSAAVVSASYAEALPGARSSAGLNSILGLSPNPHTQRKYAAVGALTEGAVLEARRLRNSFAEVLDRMLDDEAAWASIPSIHPLDDASLSSRYGYRRDPFTGRTKWHDGVDFSATTGTPIRAAADGRVIRSGWFGGYGKMVELDHGNGMTTLYAHTSRTAVKNGDRVRRGQVIGYVGRTGRANAPHLHYEVRVDGRNVNPQSHLVGSVALAD